MTRMDLDAVLGHLAEATSLVGTDRICLAYTAGGSVPDVDHSVGCELRWRGSVVPWWLAPLRLIAAANRTLFEITEARDLPTFVGATDIPDVISNRRSGVRRVLGALRGLAADLRNFRRAMRRRVSCRATEVLLVRSDARAFDQCRPRAATADRLRRRPSGRRSDRQNPQGTTVDKTVMYAHRRS